MAILVSLVNPGSLVTVVCLVTPVQSLCMALQFAKFQFYQAHLGADIQSCFIIYNDL